MTALLDRLRACLFWLGLAAIHPNRDHRRHGWVHTTRKEYRMSALIETTPTTSTGGQLWRIARDGDRIGAGLFARHYSARQYRDGRPRRLFVGPGEKLVLIGHDDRALFVWRRFVSMDDQVGINCAVFRNESPVLASDLIREADMLADERWPDEPRHYTYVAPARIRSTNPGYCFLQAGWRRCGLTKGGHGRDQLVILDRVGGAA